ncbi:MAG TPA: hypothetical protein PLN52_16750 [Opitutaceae bacterium]|nr:hypothetical protein [Opitutaceae bacterium]
MNTAIFSTPLSWIQMQTELRDIAYQLDLRGSVAAAELAVALAARIEDLLTQETKSEGRLSVELAVQPAGVYGRQK